jgi:hypothetical protein
MSLDSWVFRSDAAFPVDLMILTKSANECDSLLTNQSSSMLMSLPLELVALIGNFLDPVDKVCFTLTCKRAACGVGIKSWGLFGKATGSPIERWKLLETLKRDLPDYHLCFYLGRLCNLSSKAPLGSCQRRRLRRPESEISVAAIKKPDHSRFGLLPSADIDGPAPTKDDGYLANPPSFCDIQLLVESHLCKSPYEFTASDFSFSQPWRNSYQLRSSNPRFNKLFGDLEIAENELRLYTAQHRVVGYVPEDIDETLNPLYKKDNWYDFGTPVCRHPRRFDCADIGLDTTRVAMTEIFTKKKTYWQSATYTCPLCQKYFRFAAFKHAEHNALDLVIQSVQIFGPKNGVSGPDWTELAWNWTRYRPEPCFVIAPFCPNLRGTYPTRDMTVSEPYHPLAPEEEAKLFTKDHAVVSAFDEEVLSKLRDQRRKMIAEKLAHVKDRVADRAGVSWIKWHLITAPKIAYRGRRARKLRQGEPQWTWT